MPNTHATLSALFTDIASAIREKSGTSETIIADNFPSAIQDIPTGGGGEKPTLPQGTWENNSVTQTISYNLSSAGQFGSVIDIRLQNQITSNVKTLASVTYSSPWNGSIYYGSYIKNAQGLEYGNNNVQFRYKPQASLVSLFNIPEFSTYGVYFYPGYDISGNTVIMTSAITTSYFSNVWVPSASGIKFVQAT